jgi:hypothetical protein
LSFSDPNTNKIPAVLKKSPNTFIEIKTIRT